MHRIIKQTQCWLDSVIIKHNICPFAKRERDKGSIHFCVDENQNISQALESYPNPELIPERNIEYCQSLGLKKMRAMLKYCQNRK